jgi:N-acetylglucosamine-6-phosphate deacetylase
MTGSLLVSGARIRGVGEPRSILIRSGRITAIGDVDGREARRVPRIDAGGRAVLPGFIDLQVNGAGGRDLTAEPGSVWDVGAALTRWGTTAFLPTLVSTAPATYQEAADVAASGPPPDYRGAAALGWHFEGPFLAASRHGAHDPAMLRLPDAGVGVAMVSGWSRAAGVAMVTLAPELRGALALVDRLTRQGVIVSAGHSEATAAEAAAGFDAGVQAVTHAWNAMRPLDHREPGLLGAAFADPRVAVMLIPDGLHVAPDVVRLTWNAIGRQRFVAVTDAIAALGQPDGAYPLGTVQAHVAGGAARLDDGRLAGSVLSMDRALANLDRWSRDRFAAALAAVTSTPAAVIGEQDRGRVRRGARGDLVLVDEQLVPQATIIGGEIVFEAGQGA